MSQNIQISGQKPAQLYPQHTTLPVISPKLPPEEYFEAIKDAVNGNISLPLFTPFSSAPVDIQVDGHPRYGTSAVGQWIVDYIKSN